METNRGQQRKIKKQKNSSNSCYSLIKQNRQTAWTPTGKSLQHIWHIAGLLDQQRYTLSNYLHMHLALVQVQTEIAHLSKHPDPFRHVTNMVNKFGAS